MRADLKDLHARFYAAFKQAESAIKSAEHAGEDLPIPCINELRYAGYHHIRSDQFFADGFHEKAEEEMRKAFDVLQKTFVPFEGEIVRIELAKKNPYRVIESWELKHE